MLVLCIAKNIYFSSIDKKNNQLSHFFFILLNAIILT